MLNEEKLNKIFTQLGESCLRGSEITLCGGAAMVLNYNSRLSTRDVDCLRVDNIIRTKADELAATFDLENDWLNDNVCVTSSYSNELVKLRELYNTYGNLTVYTVKGLPLLCMKLVSWRANSSDFNDCEYMTTALREHHTIQDVYDMVTLLYGNTSLLSVEAQKFLSYQFGQDEYQLDAESLDSFVYAIEDGLMTIDDVPTEFKKQVESRMSRDVDSALDRLCNISGGNL